jgi:two-component system KDP operon response regulator KdpE
LIILDWGLPDLDGQLVLRRLREWSTAPLIVLSARDQEQQKVDALDGGDDDYVTKPFGVDELLARMRTALRHVNRTDSDQTSISIGDLRIDLAKGLVYRKNEEVHLTPLEYKLLVRWRRIPAKSSRIDTCSKKSGGPHEMQEMTYLRVFVASLRRKLEDDPARPQYILTESQVGYRLAAE